MLYLSIFQRWQSLVWIYYLWQDNADCVPVDVEKPKSREIELVSNFQYNKVRGDSSDGKIKIF